VWLVPVGLMVTCAGVWVPSLLLPGGLVLMLGGDLVLRGVTPTSGRLASPRGKGWTWILGGLAATATALADLLEMPILQVLALPAVLAASAVALRWAWLGDRSRSFRAFSEVMWTGPLGARVGSAMVGLALLSRPLEM
jgi:uncharacterized membrane protein HdeD (DUF308 family)